MPDALTDPTAAIKQLQDQQALQSEALYAAATYLSERDHDAPMVSTLRTLVNALNPDSYTFTPPPPAALVYAIDVSSNNGLDIGSVLERHKPQHVITKLYQRAELGGGGERFPTAHAAAARARGMTVGGYGWLYAGIDGARQVGDFLATATAAGIALGPTNPLWLDCEDYTDGSYPDLGVIRQAVAECAQRGVACGIYTGKWWWVPRTGDSAEFAHLPLWASIYDGQAVMVDVDFGGWTGLAGKQWSGSPIDRSVFRAEYASP